jgi:uncharacterized protein (TIGR02284 family)
MISKTAQLNELIEITRDGQRFYEHAREEVKDARLQALFHDMAQGKREVIQALVRKVVDSHEAPAPGGTFVGLLRQVYADTRAALSSDQAATYVVQLEAAEERILHAFEDAVESAEPEVHDLLVGQMSKVRACHERMRDLKQSMQSG